MPIEDEVDLGALYRIPAERGGVATSTFESRSRSFQPRKFTFSLLDGPQLDDSDWFSRLLAETGVHAPALAHVPLGWAPVFEAMVLRLVEVPGWDRVLTSIDADSRALKIGVSATAPSRVRALIAVATRRCWRVCARCGHEARLGTHFRGPRGMNPRGHARVETTCEDCHRVLLRDDPEGLHGIR